MQNIASERSPKIPGHVVHIDPRFQRDGIGKRCSDILIGAIGGADIIDDLCDPVMQEELGGSSMVVADELKVWPLLRPEAARTYAEWVVETDVAAALGTTGKRGSGGKDGRPVRPLSSLHTGVSKEFHILKSDISKEFQLSF